jgi:type IV pilus assembly protein PilN
MLVEINLLPKKEHRKSSQLIIAAITLLLIAITISIIFLQGSSYENKMKQVDQKISNLQKLNNLQQEKLAEENAGNSVIKLQEAVQWAEKYPVQTVPIVRNIISLLPERGFIQNFEYSNMDSILVTIQYDASRDAAFYLSSLKQSEWVKEAELLNVVALEISDDAEENNSTDGVTLPRYSADYKIVYRPEFFKPEAGEGGDGS